MFCDEGVGIYAVEYIKQNFTTPQELDIIDGGGLGFTLMTCFQEYDKVFILSTTSQGESCEIFSFDRDELLSQGVVRQNANEVEVAQMLEICSILEDSEMAQIKIISIHPHDTLPVVADLTTPIKEVFPNYIKKVSEVLEGEGFLLKPKEESKSLEEIISSYANPTQKIHISN
jgi:hydrogenase maturation protease